MHYQADYFHRYPNSSFILLADNVAYPFNEFLHIMVDQGIMGLLFLLLLLHSLFSFTNDRLLKAALLTFGVFSFFSYSADVLTLYPHAEECYKMAAAMVPSRLLPNYKLFQLYVDSEKKEAALRIGQLLLEQPVKKEGTKTLRMKAEVLKYIHCDKTR